MKRRWWALLALALVLAACAPGSDVFAEPGGDEAGFLYGIWHGWIAPITLIVQIFNSDIRVYEPHNTGWWYDFGFYIAILGGFGGFALTRRRRKRPVKIES